MIGLSNADDRVVKCTAVRAALGSTYRADDTDFTWKSTESSVKLHATEQAIKRNMT